MKVAIAQIGTDPGNFTNNKSKILDYIERAKKLGAELVVFPEGALQGYAHLDLILKKDFLVEVKRHLAELAQMVEGITAVIGFVDQEVNELGPNDKPVLYNSLAIISDRKIKAIIDKTLLPEYDIFSEARYFTKGKRNSILQLSSTAIGLGICEDLWSEGYKQNIYEEHIKNKASLLVNASASPYNLGKDRERYDLISNITVKNSLPFIYANLVGSYDGYDGEVVFDGRSMVFNKHGKLCAMAKSFEEDLIIADIDSAKEIEFQEIEDDIELTKALILGIREYFRRTNLKTAYIGLSGGIDSALVVALCVMALGRDNVVAVTMPSHITSSETLNDSHLLAKNFGIRIDERSIKNEYLAWLNDFKEKFKIEPESLTKQNKQARIRGSILMEYTNQDRKGLVVSTGNKTELALGYCTLYGDMCGGLSAISDLSKERVYLLAKYINKYFKSEVIPKTIIDRIPTAELEEGQTDRANLPADYDIISPLVDDVVERELSLEDLYKKYNQQIVDRTIRLININEFKRRQATPGIRVTKKAFGIGRRVPIA
jgi:NAD+ synthase (glutamine-hydrolysing)